jgi:hypothetical protein
LSPKANDVVQAGFPYEFKWGEEMSDKNLFGEMVAIELSKEAGTSWQQVEENVPKDGIYMESAKIELAQCKVRVFSQRCADYRGTSGVFAVK